MLIIFKSAPILKRALKVKHAMMQVYVLKLIKLQTKYLGRQWRKSNMKTMSAIYNKVRHRLTDDWAFGNGKLKDLSNFMWFWLACSQCRFICAVSVKNRNHLMVQAKKAKVMTLCSQNDPHVVNLKITFGRVHTATKGIVFWNHW